MFALIAVQYLFHDGIEAAWRAFRQTGTATATSGALVHIVPGLLVLAFALWRLALRLTRGSPPPPAGTPAWMARTAGLIHWALYALMLLVPASGAAAWFLGATGAGAAHEVLKTLLLVLIGLHVLAVLYHQIVRRDGLLARMRP
ncbi:cytochrome b [Pseudooceanicola sp. LIPI14-2-Ac024]|uniref:cytochrome b n=1 Tax=Pseudooceanicola sp. LIPI14-2-Ac024 TaxID=3344875 RepID=UPI0035D13760